MTDRMREFLFGPFGEKSAAEEAADASSNRVCGDRSGPYVCLKQTGHDGKHMSQFGVTWDAIPKRASDPHRLDHDAILAYCKTNDGWANMGEWDRLRTYGEAAKESMQWWVHDQTEAAYDKGVEDGRATRNRVWDYPTIYAAILNSIHRSGYRIEGPNQDSDVNASDLADCIVTELLEGDD